MAKYQLFISPAFISINIKGYNIKPLILSWEKTTKEEYEMGWQKCLTITIISKM